MCSAHKGDRAISDNLDKAIHWLGALVAMDTRNGTGDEIVCTQFLANALKAHEPDALVCETVSRTRGKSDSGYVLARWGTPRILLNVHIDTVPSGDGWTGSPFKLRQSGDKYIGLGTSDIKGAAACILAALKTTSPKDVAILFSGDEEHGSEVMPEAIKRGHYGGAPMAIVCEPTGCTVGQRHRGMLAFSVDYSGPGGHSSLADNVAAPLLRAARLASAIGEYGDKHKDFESETYKGLCTNIGEIKTDGSYNVIPTTASLKFSLRPPPGDNVTSREADIARIHQEVSPDETLDQIVSLNPFKSRDVSAFQPFFGSGFDVVDLPYWTEAAMLSEAGVNAVVFGPGQIAQAHTPNEFVTGEQLLKAIPVYQRALSGEFV